MAQSATATRPPAEEIENRDLLTIRAAARQLDMGERTLRRIISTGQFPREMVLRRPHSNWIRIKANDIPIYLETLRSVLPTQRRARRANAEARQP
jgi:hypothetical protein